MGQYYYIVNIDKHEHLHPHKFDDGLKLLEFGCSAYGVMTALAILLADGNGRGGGDICISGPVSELGEPKPHQLVDHRYDIDGKPYETRVPKSAGRWAGDRIVITGDYADAKYLPSGMPQIVTYTYLDISGQPAVAKNIRLNLFGWVNMTKKQCTEAGVLFGDFKDVSDDALKAMTDDPYVRKVLEKERSRALKPDIVLSVVK